MRLSLIGALIDGKWARSEGGNSLPGCASSGSPGDFGTSRAGSVEARTTLAPQPSHLLPLSWSRTSWMTGAHSVVRTLYLRSPRRQLHTHKSRGSIPSRTASAARVVPSSILSSGAAGLRFGSSLVSRWYWPQGFRGRRSSSNWSNGRRRAMQCGRQVPRSLDDFATASARSKPQWCPPDARIRSRTVTPSGAMN
jgi:hypothetical protein